MKREGCRSREMKGGKNQSNKNVKDDNAVETIRVPRKAHFLNQYDKTQNM